MTTPAEDERIDYALFEKKLTLPAGVAAPRRLVYEGLEARAISRADLHDDVAGINGSLNLIRRTRGGKWPSGPVTEDFNFVDLVWHECEFRDGGSYTYAVYTSDGQYIGCCYMYPLGTRTPLSEALLDYDVDVSWWVTPSAYHHGAYTRLYAALKFWIANEFPSWRPYYSNREIPPAPSA
jgi:hypothetical protein